MFWPFGGRTHSSCHTWHSAILNFMVGLLTWVGRKIYLVLVLSGGLVLAGVELCVLVVEQVNHHHNGSGPSAGGLSGIAFIWMVWQGGVISWSM